MRHSWTKEGPRWSYVRTGKGRDRCSSTWEKQGTASQGSAETQNQQDIDLEGDFSEELAHAMTGAENSSHLPSLSWRPGNAAGTFNVSLKAWEQVSWWLKSLRSTWAELRCPRSSRQVGSRQGHVLPSSAFCPIQAPSGRHDAHPHGAHNPLYWAHGFQDWSHPETPSQTHQS